MRGRVVAAVAVMGVGLVLGGCGTATSSPASSTPAVTRKAALGRWDKAYTFLRAQTKPVEVVCMVDVPTKADGSGLDYSRARTAFYSLNSAEGGWQTYLDSRDNTAAEQQAGTHCSINVPTSYPYGPAIDRFLRTYGYWFYGAEPPSEDLQRVEITYAGQNSSDPDIIYFKKPGLFGLRLAFIPLSASAFKPNSSEIVEPPDAASAEKYLQYAKPLLDWYGYKG